MTAKRGVPVEIMEPAKTIVDQIQGWSRLSRKEVINAVLEWLGTVDQDTQGAIIGALPQSRRPEFARMLLEEISEPLEKTRDILDHIARGKPGPAGTIIPDSVRGAAKTPRK